MMYLTPQSYAKAKSRYPPHWGQILTPSNFARPTAGRRWAGDNEAFTGKFEWQRFYTWLEKFQPYQSRCLFVAVPDVVCDPHTTGELFAEYAPSIKELGYPVAFVAQDGQESLPFPEIDALFIGGSTEWKLSEAADECIRYAQRLGKWVHVGRVNSQRRIRHFQLVGVDSVDGTTLCFGPDKNFRIINSQLIQKPLLQILRRD